MEKCTRTNVTQIIEESVKNRLVENDVESTLKLLEENGYTCNEVQKEYFSQYLGIEVVYASPVLQGRKQIFTVNPLDVVEEIYREVVSDYESHTKKSFIIFGEIVAKAMVVYIAETGEIYGGNEEYLINYGLSLEDFLYDVMNGTKIDVEVVIE